MMETDNFIFDDNLHDTNNDIKNEIIDNDTINNIVNEVDEDLDFDIESDLIDYNKKIDLKVDDDDESFYHSFRINQPKRSIKLKSFILFLFIFLFLFYFFLI